MRAIIIDTETTDSTDPEAIEVAWIDPANPEKYYCERFLPSKPITLGAMATHHIVLSDLKNCRPSAEFMLPPVEFIIGHNVDFDWKVLGSPDVKRICTLALSRWLFPEIDSHTQSAMMYHLFPHEVAREQCLNAHSALADVRMCNMILNDLIRIMESRNVKVDTIEDIWAASEIARVPTVMAFGKHKGMAIKDVPSDYKMWLLRQTDIDPYLIQAIRGSLS